MSKIQVLNTAEQSVTVLRSPAERRELRLLVEL